MIEKAKLAQVAGSLKDAVIVGKGLCTNIWGGGAPDLLPIWQQASWPRAARQRTDAITILASAQNYQLHTPGTASQQIQPELLHTTG